MAGGNAGLAEVVAVALVPAGWPPPLDEQPTTAMAGQSRATATNRRAEIITRHATARVRGRGAGLVGHLFWRRGTVWLVVVTEWLVVVTEVTNLRAPFT